ncbi:hypothetical protein MCHI_002189 [Candidatus Magnetoovum chiemensis]|nr:hypothetical protein MCHI_002189 [Candidatus Magnetoovum chiemensis]
MGALTKDRATKKRDGAALHIPAAAGKKFYAGAIVAINADGYATPGATATGLKGLGRCEKYADNSDGDDGDVNVDISKGVFLYGNSSSGDEITRAEIGSACYIVDDQTVAKTDGTGTRSQAGTVFDVSAEGVWVKF